jgi:hypothetical protein
MQPQAAPLSLFAHSGEADSFHALLRVNHARQTHSIVLGNGAHKTQQVAQAILAEVQRVYESPN